MDPLRRIGGPRAGALWLLGVALLVALLVLLVVRAQKEQRAPTTAAPGGSATTVESAPVVPDAAVTAPAARERAALAASTATQAQAGPTSASMRGTILVDGRPPEWPVPLEFAEQPGGQGPEVAGDSFALVRGVVVPEEGGAFDFGAFPASWRGRLLADGYAFEGGAAELVLDAPRADLVLRLRSPPQITGRVIDPHTHAPVPEVLLRAFLLAKVERAPRAAQEFEAGLPVEVSTTDEYLDPHRGASNAHGRFRIALYRDAVERSGEIVFESAGRWRRAVTLPTIPAGSGLELGDIELAPAFAQPFRILNESGAPIRGGRALDPARLEVYAHADDAGRGVLECVPPEGLEVLFSALDHRDESRTVVPGEPLEIHLRRATRLELRLVSPQAGFADVKARISAAQPLFVPFEVRSDWHRLQASDKDFRRERVLTFKDDGVLREGNLLPAVPFEIQIFHDQQILATRSAELVEGEWLTLEIPITLPARPALVPFTLNR